MYGLRLYQFVNNKLNLLQHASLKFREVFRTQSNSKKAIFAKIVNTLERLAEF